MKQVSNERSELLRLSILERIHSIYNGTVQPKETVSLDTSHIFSIYFSENLLEPSFKIVSTVIENILFSTRSMSFFRAEESPGIYLYNR